jgi:uncharacterized protein YjdB
MSRVRSFTALAFAASALVACGDDDPITEPVCEVSNIAITQAPQTITVGNLGTLQVQVTATNCDPAPTVAWTTSNANFAIVSASGVVTGIAPGNVTISAAAGGKTSNVQIQIVGDSGPVN